MEADEVKRTYVVYAYDFDDFQEHEWFLDLTEAEAKDIEQRLEAISLAARDTDPFITEYGVTLLRAERRDMGFDEWITDMEAEVKDYLESPTVPAG